MGQYYSTLGFFPAFNPGQIVGSLLQPGNLKIGVELYQVEREAQTEEQRIQAQKEASIRQAESEYLSDKAAGQTELEINRLRREAELRALKTGGGFGVVQTGILAAAGVVGLGVVAYYLRRR